MNEKDNNRNKLYFIIGLMAIIIVILIGVIFSIYNKDDVKKDEEKDVTSTTTIANVPFKKKYEVIKNGFITFDNDGKCSVDFSGLENDKNVYGTIMEVKYYDGDCTYTKLDDFNLVINYTGYGSLLNTYYDADKKQNIETEVQRLNIFNGVRVKFNEDYSKLETLNGEFKEYDSEVKIYFYAVDSKYKEEVTTTKKTSTKTSTTSKVENKTTTKKIISNTTSNKAVIDSKLKAELQLTNYEYYVVVLKTSDKDKEDNSYWVYINGEEHYSKYSDGTSKVGNMVFKKPGKHCVDVSVKDKYGAKKDFGELCINFTPEKLDYSARIEKMPNGQYSLWFRDNKELGGDHYNSIYNVDIYHNGVKISRERNDEFYTGVWDTCKHSIKIVNKYNQSQEINLSC